MATAKVKSPYTKDELKKIRVSLLEKRDELSHDIEDLARTVTEAENGHSLPTHQADRGFDSELQDISLGVMDDETTLLWQIDRAIRKIDHAKPLPYGICEHFKRPIQKNRLKFLPWTPISIEASEVMEEEGLTLHDMLDND